MHQESHILKHLVKCEKSVIPSNTIQMLQDTATVAPGTTAMSPGTLTSSSTSVNPCALMTPGTTAATPCALMTTGTTAATQSAVTAATPVSLVKIPRTLRPSTKEYTKCPNCGLLLYKQNLRRHILRKHSSTINDITADNHLKSQCIDDKNGVFAVAKSFQGTCFPIDAIKKTWGTKQSCLRSGGMQRNG